MAEGQDHEHLALPEWNETWKPFHERSTENAIPGTYYVRGKAMQFPPDPDMDTPAQRARGRSSFWFSTTDNVDRSTETALTKFDVKQLTSLQLITYSRNDKIKDDDQTGSGTWFEVAIRERGATGREKHAEKLPNGQLLSWLSHSNWFKTEQGSNKWCRGRMFTKGDEIFKYLKAGDIISVRMSAGPNHTNYADAGYLVFGFGNGPETFKTPTLRSPSDNPPLISVYAQERQEYLTIPVDGSSSEIRANVVKGGVDLMKRLLTTQDNDWKVQHHTLGPAVQVAANSPNFDSVVELAGAKHGSSPQIVKQSTIKKPRQTPSINDAGNDVSAKVIVLDDSEVNKGDGGNVVLDPRTEVLVYQMHAPLWFGTLWDTVLTNADHKVLAERLKGLEDFGRKTLATRLGLQGNGQQALTNDQQDAIAELERRVREEAEKQALEDLENDAKTKARGVVSTTGNSDAIKVLTDQAEKRGELKALTVAKLDALVKDQRETLAKARPEDLAKVEIKSFDNFKKQADEEAKREINAKAELEAIDNLERQALAEARREIVTEDNLKAAAEKKLKAIMEAKLETLVVAAKQDLSTIIVIDADDLRADGIRISRGISWEKTMEDFHAQIGRINDKIKGAQKDGDKDRVLNIMQRGVHLLVRCGYEGVLHLRPKLDRTERPFVFHMVPNMAEGDLLRLYRGQMSGIDLAFGAGLAAYLARHPKTSTGKMGRTQIGAAIELAIVWSHRFASIGFCKDGSGFNYPEAKDINNYRTSKTKVIYGDQNKMGEKYRIGYVPGDQQPVNQQPVNQQPVNQQPVNQQPIDQQPAKKENGWSLFSLLEQKRHSVAAEVVKLGTERLETSIPTVKFGLVQTADRTEIEGYRSTAAVIHEYLNNKVKKPLSIAVFGQPGAGKSFGVKEVIKALLNHDKDWEPIEANLSQFLQYSDLVRVFDKVRDTALKGEIPVVLFDEFDSGFNGPLGWLKYFLAPMQDGQFLDSGFVRPLGRAIFVFIGGTSSTFSEFKYGTDVTPAELEAAKKEARGKVDDEKRAAQRARVNAAFNRREADNEAVNAATKARKAAKKNVRELADKMVTKEDKKAKKPDFVSRLSAHIDVKGPNESDDDDVMFVMRRAMLLQGQLRKHFKVDPKDIRVDETVLNALLKHTEFPNGARSIELILQSSRLSGGRRFESSDLPSDEQLRMHVGDVTAFHGLLDEPIDVEDVRPVDIDLYNKLMWARLEKETD